MGTKKRTSTIWLSNNFFTLETNSGDGISTKKKKNYIHNFINICNI